MTATATSAAPTLAPERRRMGRPPVTSRLARREFDEQVRRAAAVEAEQLRRRIEQMQRELRRLEQWIGRDVR